MADQLIETQLDGLKEKCPAFESGCPYASPELKGLMKDVEKCPEFKDKCPFKNAESLSDIYERIGKVSHAKLNDSHEKGLVELINSIHSISKELSNTVGECPVFSTDSGCPFKSLCTDGTPLLKKLDALSWSKVVDDSLESIVHDVALSKELKTGTRKSHKVASRVHFVRAFLKGEVDEKLYRASLACFYFIYKALEEENRKLADHPMFSHIHLPEQLDRVGSLEKDLHYYYGDDWRDEITTNDSVTEYVDRIHYAAKKDPALLIAHHYTRYLGDLSGGQTLRKAAIKAYGLPSTGEGSEFYDFRNVDNPNEFKNVYRRKLDSIELSKEKADELVEESKVAFALNIKLFKELDMLGGFVEEVEHEITESELSSKPKVCPFLVTKKEAENSSIVGTQLSKCPVTALKRNSNRIVLILSVVVLAIAMLFALGVRPVGGA